LGSFLLTGLTCLHENFMPFVSQVAKDPLFAREGADLYVDYHISFTKVRITFVLSLLLGMLIKVYALPYTFASLLVGRYLGCSSFFLISSNG